MKNIYYFLIFAVYMLLYQEAQAQFEAKQSFVSGNLSIDITSFKLDATEPSQSYNYYDLGVSWGQFTQSNRSSGWGINSSLASLKYTDPLLNIPSLQQLSLGGNHFFEFYKPLAEKFAFYLTPSVGLTYRLENVLRREDSENYLLDQTNSLILGASLSAGIAWRITQKWALYGGFALVNPIRISGGAVNTKRYSTNTHNKVPIESRGSVFDYNFAPSLNTTSIGLGFRYFYTRKYI